MSCFLSLFLLLVYIIFVFFPLLFLLLYKLLSYIFKPKEEYNNVAFSITLPYILVAEYRRERRAENEDTMNLQSTGNHVTPLRNRNLNPQKNRDLNNTNREKCAWKMIAGWNPWNSALLGKPAVSHIVNKFLTRNFVTFSQFRVSKSVNHYTFNWINPPDAATSQVYYLSFNPLNPELNPICYCWHY